MLLVWNMTLTESTNFLIIRNMVVAFTTKSNIKGTFMGKDGFLQIFIW